MSISQPPVDRPESGSPPEGAPRASMRAWKVAALGVAALAAGAAALVWAFTEPLTPAVTPVPLHNAAGSRPAVAPPEPPGRPEWPRDTLSGQPAKELLLKTLRLAEAHLESVPGYTATFRKQERMKGVLGPMQVIQLKLRHDPFAIYLKFLAPKKGKEVLYAQGLHEDKVIAHNGDWTRRLIPRVAFRPTDALALADNRHPVTEAGIENLTKRLIKYRELDITDSRAETVLDRMRDDAGREWLRSVHLHPIQIEERPFSRVEVLYNPDTFIPLKITSYDWPKPGASGPPQVAESYEYDDLKLDAPLTERDFDLANPEYEFTRF